MYKASNIENDVSFDKQDVKSKECPPISNKLILEFCIEQLNNGIYFSNITFSDIAQRFEVAKTNIVYYFPNKEKLYNALAKYFADKTLPLPETLTKPQHKEIKRSYVSYLSNPEKIKTMLDFCVEQLNAGRWFKYITFSAIGEEIGASATMVQRYFRTRENLKNTLVKYYEDKNLPLPETLLYDRKPLSERKPKTRKIVSQETIITFCVQQLEKGVSFEKLTPKTISKEFGATRGACNYFFPKKESLYNALVKYYNDNNLPLPETLIQLKKRNVTEHKKEYPPISSKLIIEFCVKQLAEGVNFQSIKYITIAKAFERITKTDIACYFPQRKALYDALIKYYQDQKLDIPKTLRFLSKDNIFEFYVKQLDSGVHFKNINIREEFGVPRQNIKYYVSSMKELYSSLVKYYQDRRLDIPRTLRFLSKENIIEFCVKQLDRGIHFKDINISAEFGATQQNIMYHIGSMKELYDELVKYYQDINGYNK